MILQDVFSQYDVENNKFECKSRLDKENVLGWLKTIDGFANSTGGIIFLGVEDKTNKLIGYDASDIDKEKIYFYNQLKEHFDILPSVSIDLIPYNINGKKRYVLKIFILESNVKPVILKYQGMPMIFLRRDGFTSPATTEEIIQMSIKGNTPKFDTGKTTEKYSFNDFKMLQEFYNKNTGLVLREKELAAIGFYTDDGYLKNGSLLFKDDYNGKLTTVVCSSYNGNTRGDNYIITSNIFTGNLISCYQYIYEFINQRMNHGFLKKNTSRVDIDSFPKRSLFEAIINALAHRDYFLSGSAIYVDLFKNRLVISSPGGFFGTGDMKKTYKLDSFISKRRNELICDIFIMCKAMEAKGTGFEKILEDYKNVDLKYKPFIFAKNNQFSIVLPDLTNKDGVGLDDDSITLLNPLNNQSKYDIQILAYCYYERRTVKEITEHLGVSNSTFFRKSILNNLISQNYLKEGIEGNAKAYYTNTEYVKII